MVKMIEKFRQFMYGRYGTDQLSIVLVVAGIVLYILSLITRIGIFYILSWVCYGYDIFRTLSKNIPKRQLENQKFLQLLWKIKNLDIANKAKGWWEDLKCRFDEEKTYRKFRCPNCGQKIRVPRGRGKIAVTCPKCGVGFIKKV